MVDLPQLIARYRSLSGRARGDIALVERVEAEVSARPQNAFTFGTDGQATLKVAGHAFAAGSFSTPSIAELRIQDSGTGARSRLWLMLGTEAWTDIGFLQAALPAGTTFQVASQFNCLEAPGPDIVPVHEYFSDPTQGPRAAASAFPGALLRHYAATAADGSRFVQTAQRQLNLLERAAPPEIARVQSGYLMTPQIPNLEHAAAVFEERFDKICVGLHRNLEVVFGDAWNGSVDPGQRIDQVTTSTLAVGYSGRIRVAGAVERICRTLLRAAYLGTFLATKKSVVLTLIGGGVFANPHRLIAEEMLLALEERDRNRSEPLEVLLNCRQLDDSLNFEWLLEEARSRGGGLLKA